MNPTTPPNAHCETIIVHLVPMYHLAGAIWYINGHPVERKMLWPRQRPNETPARYRARIIREVARYVMRDGTAAGRVHPIVDVRPTDEANTYHVTICIRRPKTKR
jgi:hypothetical protein